VTHLLQGEVFNRPAMDDMLKRRMFFVPAFEIYGGVAGFYDFGPIGCGLKVTNNHEKYLIFHLRLPAPPPGKLLEMLAQSLCHDRQYARGGMH
jgi:hypothetical protein